MNFFRAAVFPMDGTGKLYCHALAVQGPKFAPRGLSPPPTAAVEPSMRSARIVRSFNFELESWTAKLNPL
jgi:hypothetical protein